MQDIGEALKQYRGLIKWIARRYAVLGNFRLSQQDLEAEGYLVLVKCCRRFPRHREGFDGYFKTSLYNHIKTLITTERRDKRMGINVELEEAVELAREESLVKLTLKEKIESIRSHLSTFAYRLLQELLEPSPQVVEFARREFLRRNKLHSLGISVGGYRKFRIRERHIRKVFGWKTEDCNKAMSEIRRVYSSQLIHRRSR